MDEQSNKPQKIVIVEDNVSLNEIYKTRLELLGYACFPAFDGQSALDIIQKELPDLVLLDLMVPKIAGDRILELMRQNDWGKSIKVFVISNLSEADAPSGIRNFGIEGYAVKANLAFDQIDRIVNGILKPGDQDSDSSQEKGTNAQQADVPPVPVSNEQVAVHAPPPEVAEQPAGATSPQPEPVADQQLSQTPVATIEQPLVEESDSSASSDLQTSEIETPPQQDTPAGPPPQQV